jgi:hypothetical protein
VAQQHSHAELHVLGLKEAFIFKSKTEGPSACGTKPLADGHFASRPTSHARLMVSLDMKSVFI